MKHIIVVLLALLTSVSVLQAQQQAQQPTPQPNAAQVYAWYREDGIQNRGNLVTAWNSSATNGTRALNQVVGTPKMAHVKTPQGEKNIVSFDGASALWQRLDRWGEIKGDLTIVALARLKSADNGFLFDGSTGAGLTRAQVRSGQWQIGAQNITGSATAVAGNADANTHKAEKGVWQTHVFTFHKAQGDATHSVDGAVKTVDLKSKSPLAGFILGANGAAKGGLRADVAEILIYDRALPDKEMAAAISYLKTKWGALEFVADANAAAADKAAIAAKLADKTKPLIWLWSGQNRNEKSLGTARNQPQHFAERVRWELGRRRDIVIDTRLVEAAPGALEKNFEARIARFHPDVVILNLVEGDDAVLLIEKVRKIGAIPILQSGVMQSAALRKIAAQDGVFLIETPALAAGSAANAGQIELNDVVALFRALGIDDPKSSVDRQLEGVL